MLWASRSWKKQGRKPLPSPRTLQRLQGVHGPNEHLDFGLVASRSMRGYISRVLSHLVYGALPGPQGRRGGGPPGVGSWQAARPWRRRTACTSSGRACVPTRCGWEPRALRAGRTRSAPALGEGGSDLSQPPHQLPGVGAWGGGRWPGRSVSPDRFPKCLGALNLTYSRPLLPSSEPMWEGRAPDPGASFTRKRRRR